MNYEYAIDNCLDDREFRNLINTILMKNGFTYLGIDDPSLSDDDGINNNDILVKCDNIKYTVQTFLNKDINMDKVKETLDDMEKENVMNGIIISNRKVSDEVKKKAHQHNIDVWDRDKLVQLLEK